MITMRSPLQPLVCPAPGQRFSQYINFRISADAEKQAEVVLLGFVFLKKVSKKCEAHVSLNRAR